MGLDWISLNSLTTRSPCGDNKTITPSLRFFINLARDELKEKYKGMKFQRYAASADEVAAINWMKAEMGWTQTLPETLNSQNIARIAKLP